MKHASRHNIVTKRGGILFVAVLLVASLGLSPALWAEPAETETATQKPERSRRSLDHSAKEDLPGLAERLDLSEEQVQQMETIKLEFLKRTADLRNEMHKTKLEISGLVRDPEASEAEILALQKQKIALKSRLMETAAEYQLKARSLLTPDQIRKLPADQCGLGFLGPGKKGHRRHGEAP